MVTRDNFAALVQTLPPDEIQEELNAPGDYIFLSFHIFNGGAFALIESEDYDPDSATAAMETGALYCDKDDFRRLLDETGALEY